VPEPRDSLLHFVLSRLRVHTAVCSRQKFETGYILPTRTVPDYNYIWVTRGTVVWVIEDVEHTMNAGDMVVVPPNVEHRGYSTTKRGTLGSIHVMATLGGGQDVFQILTPTTFRSIMPKSRLERYLHGALAEYDRNDADATYLTMDAWGRLTTLELLRHDAAAGLLKQRELDPLIAELLDELQRRIERVTTLDELAEWSGFTAQHLNRTFRRVLGVTPLQHLTRLRMDRAAALLKEGVLTVKAVAAAVAIDDPYYFSRVFSEHFGVSPTQYRTTAGSENPS
jgi:AraC-like DNA-binding protein